MVQETKPSLKINAKGKDIDSVFTSAGRELFSKMTNIANVQPKKNAKLKVTGKTIEELLGNYLNELILLKKTKGMYYSQFRTKISEKIIENNTNLFSLEGVVFGEKVIPNKGKTQITKIINESIKINKTKDGFNCEFVFE